MANIGTFKKSGDTNYTGEIVTMSLQKKNVTIVAEEASENENAPSHRVFVAKAEIGACWQKTSKEGRRLWVSLTAKGEALRRRLEALETGARITPRGGPHAVPAVYQWPRHGPGMVA